LRPGDTPASAQTSRSYETRPHRPSRTGRVRQNHAHADLTEVSEYQGEASTRVSATQLGTSYSAAAARRIVDEWVNFLAAGPSPIRELAFTTRTPRRLFEALAGQPQLRSLTVKWGDYSDLSPLTGMVGLQQLTLRGASGVHDLRPISVLIRLESLAVEGFRDIRDLSPLGELQQLTSLELGGNWMTPSNAHVGSIDVLRQLPGLQRVQLHTLIVDDKDYSPLLALPNLKAVRFQRVRGMRPPFEELKARLPWDG
jgi:hypothetical protein